MLVATAATARPGRWLRSALPDLREVVTVAELADPATPSTPAELPRLAIAPSEVALVQYTSGSTGDPKGVVLSHANLIANIRAFGGAAEARSTDVFVSWLPLYHDMGLIGAWLGSLYFGCRLVVMPPTRFLARPQDWLWALHRHRGTLSAAPNFAYEICASRIAEVDLQGLDLSAWRLASNGSEPVRPETIERFTARFSRYGFRPQAMTPVYGLAESAVGVSFTPVGRGPRLDRVVRSAFERAGRAEPAAAGATEGPVFVSVGCPIPGHEVRVVDDAGHELPDRQVGDLEFRGPSSTSGYLRNPRATAALLARAADGWLATGDRGYVAEGELYITGRRKDLIIRAGRHVSPYAGSEELVGAMPGVRRGGVAVFACPDEKTGTDTVIVVAETRSRDAAELAALRERIESEAETALDTGVEEIVFVPPRAVPQDLQRQDSAPRLPRPLPSRGAGCRARSIKRQLLTLGARTVVPLARRAAARMKTLSYAGWFWLCFASATLAACLLANLMSGRAAAGGRSPAWPGDSSRWWALPCGSTAAQTCPRDRRSWSSTTPATSTPSPS